MPQTIVVLILVLGGGHISAKDILIFSSVYTIEDMFKQEDAEFLTIIFDQDSGLNNASDSLFYLKSFYDFKGSGILTNFFFSHGDTGV
jgi:hypothetical protein